MRVLVTGGAGFIGSHVVDRLMAHGMAPVIFDQQRSVFHPDVEHSVGSILDMEALRIAMSGVETCIHLAAVADVKDVFEDPSYAETVNTRGTMCVLEAACRGRLQRVIYGSTTWVYGDCSEAEVDEETPILPPSHLYTATKLASEFYCRAYSSLYGLEYTILRFGIPYGPRARNGGVIPIFVGRALEGQPLVVAGDGAQFRQFVYVEDLANGVVLSLQPPAANRVYNLDGRESISVRQIAETVREVVGNVEIISAAARPGDFSGKRVSSSRAEQELTWKATTPFREGLRQYVGWVRSRHETKREWSRSDVPVRP